MVIVAREGFFFLSCTCSRAVVAYLHYIPGIKSCKNLLQFPRALFPLQIVTALLRDTEKRKEKNHQLKQCRDSGGSQGLLPAW